MQVRDCIEAFRVLRSVGLETIYEVVFSRRLALAGKQ